jgi:hypothetical protein
VGEGENNKSGQGSSDGVADEDATEVNPAPLQSKNGDSAISSGLTGFDKARAMAATASQETGRLLNKRFVLESTLGRGGMGVVYQARDLRKVEAEDSNPYIAVKVLAGNFKAHPQAFVTLQQEAVKTQALAHPNIVTVYDFDREDDTVFITMELLKGDPLDNLLKLEAPFGLETCLRYFRELCAGLEYAHKRGLIHSDFKPANIFVTAGGTVKILDFGIARAASQEPAKGQFDAGALGALTPAYATVEMINRKPPGFEDDVYALACVMYDMLTGRHPYGKASAAEAQDQKLKVEKPPSLSSAQWQALSKGLQLERGKRFATVESFRLAMLPPKKSPVRLVAAIAVVLLVFVAWLGYQQYRGAADREAELDGRLQAAKACYYQQDYNCAADNALAVTSLQANHQEAGQILTSSRSALALALSRAELDVRLEEAGACLAAADEGCARRAIEAARDAGATAAELYPTERGLDQMLTLRVEQAQALDVEIGALLVEASSCLERDDFDCSEQAALSILALDQANVQALELRQRATMARNLRQANEATVETFLAEAQSCFQLKNYSCSIAKAESALAILPDHPGAKQARDKAVAAQQAAKERISIQ